MRARRAAVGGLVTALALILSYVEAQFPVSVAVPGVKLGIANLAVLFALYRLGPWHALAVSGIRVILAAVLFGSGASFLYSACGAALSLLGMVLLHRWGKLGVLGVSVSGGILHNLGQILAAVILTSTPGILGYFPVLLVSGTAAGAVIGLLGGILVRRIRLAGDGGEQ